MLSLLSSCVYHQDVLFLLSIAFSDLLANTECWAQMTQKPWMRSGPTQTAFTSHLCPGHGGHSQAQHLPADTHRLACYSVAGELWMASQVKVTLWVGYSIAEQVLHQEYRKTNTYQHATVLDLFCS